MQGLPDDPLTSIKGTREELVCVECGGNFVRIFRLNSASITCSPTCSRARQLAAKRKYNRKYKAAHRAPPKVRLALTVYQAMCDEIKQLRARVKELEGGDDGSLHRQLGADQ